MSLDLCYQNNTVSRWSPYIFLALSYVPPFSRCSEESGCEARTNDNPKHPQTRHSQGKWRLAEDPSADQWQQPLLSKILFLLKSGRTLYGYLLLVPCGRRRRLSSIKFVEKDWERKTLVPNARTHDHCVLLCVKNLFLAVVKPLDGFVLFVRRHQHGTF